MENKYAVMYDYEDEREKYGEYETLEKARTAMFELLDSHMLYEERNACGHLYLRLGENSGEVFDMQSSMPVIESWIEVV